MILNALIRMLMDDTTVESLVGYNVFPVTIPQETSYPAIVLQITSTTPTRVKDSVPSVMDEIGVQLDIYAEQYSEIQSISEAIKSVLEDKDISKKGQDIDQIWQVGMNDSPWVPDLMIYHRSHDFNVRLRP